MSRDILVAGEAIDRAFGVCKGLECLVNLIQGNEASKSRADIPLEELGELLWSIQRDLEGFLDTARRSLEG